MKAFQLSAGRGLSSLIVDDRSSKPLAPHEIRVRMEAAALNDREPQILSQPDTCASSGLNALSTKGPTWKACGSPKRSSKDRPV